MPCIWVEEFLVFFFCSPRSEKIFHVAFFHKAADIPRMRVLSHKVVEAVSIFVVTEVMSINLKASNFFQIFGEETKMCLIGVF